MELFNFFKPKIDLSNKLNDCEKQSSIELNNIINDIRHYLSIEFYSEFDFTPINIYNRYDKYSNEDFEKYVLSSFKTFNHLGFDFEDRFDSLVDNLFSYSMKRARQKQFGSELDVLIKGTNSEKERIYKLAGEKKQMAFVLLLYCSSKEIILNKSLDQNKIDKFILGLILNKVNDIK